MHNTGTYINVARLIRSQLDRPQRVLKFIRNQQKKISGGKWQAVETCRAPETLCMYSMWALNGPIPHVQNMCGVPTLPA